MPIPNQPYSFNLLDAVHIAKLTGTTYPSNHQVSWHRHTQTQLLYASSGVIRLRTEQGCWVTPPLRAIWIPANTYHQLEIVKFARVKSLLVDEKEPLQLAFKKCQVITMSPLLKEIFLHLHSKQWPVNLHENQRLLEVFFDQMKTMTVEPLLYPETKHPKISNIIQSFMETPAQNESIELWAAKLHMSVRTLSRLFGSEMNMGYRQCRLQIRLIKAIEMLAQNKPVVTATYELGFSNESSFIKQFKAAFGVTPKQYFK